MTHDDAVQLIKLQMEALEPGKAHEACEKALANGINLRVRLREMPGFEVCWAIIEIVPDTKDLQARYHFNLAYHECQVFRNYFNNHKVIEGIFRQRVAKVVNGLNEYRDRLGLSLNVWDEVSKLDPERGRPGGG